MEIYYATTNQGKIQSLRRRFTESDVTVTQVPIDIPEPRSNDVQKIARAKVVFAYRQLRKPVVALDAGFYIPVLNGFPRAFVNFALETVGLDGILRLVEGKDRSCEFRECLAYLDDSLSEPKYFIAHIKGTLSLEQKGVMQPHHWSKLALIFIPEGKKKTLGEMNHDEYAGWSQNAKEKESSAQQFAEWLVQLRRQS